MPAEAQKIELGRSRELHARRRHRIQDAALMERERRSERRPRARMVRRGMTRFLGHPIGQTSRMTARRGRFGY